MAQAQQSISQLQLKTSETKTQLEAEKQENQKLDSIVQSKDARIQQLEQENADLK